MAVVKSSKERRDLQDFFQIAKETTVREITGHLQGRCTKTESKINKQQ